MIEVLIANHIHKLLQTIKLNIDIDYTKKKGNL